MGDLFRIAFLAPQIGPNFGNAIRTAAAAGAELHLIEPLGFDISDRLLGYAGSADVGGSDGSGSVTLGGGFT